MYNKDFLKKMTVKAEKDNSVVFYTRKNKTFCLSLRTGKVGIAKKNKNDKYDYYIGTGLAYCRLKNIKVPEDDDYKRGTMIKYNGKEYYVINSYYDCLSLLGGFFLDAFQTDCNMVKAGQKMEKLYFIKKPEILNKGNAEVRFRLSPSEECLKVYIEGMKKSQELNIGYIPYANMIIMQDLGSNLVKTKEIKHFIKDNYTLEENMAMAYCDLKGIKPYITTAAAKITNKYIILKATDNYCHCLNKVTGRLETLKVVNYEYNRIY